MELDELKKIADESKQLNPTSDKELGKLLQLAAATHKFSSEERDNDPMSTHKSDDEILEKCLPKIKNAVDFDFNAALDAYKSVFSETASGSLVSALPMLLRLRGRPYSLDDHFPFEGIFRSEVPLRFLLRTARQVSKSTSLAAQSVVQAGSLPFFNSLFVTPLFEQCRRFSSNYVRPFVLESPIYRAIVDKRCEQSVLQRSFKNRSIMFFQYCFRDADRVRGISADRLIVDEVQDISWDLLPVVMETLSASKWSIFHCAGTPKTMDNTIEYLWNQSSQAEWVTRCTACNHWNIACIAQDLLRMIGRDTVVCAKCERPLNPRPAFHPKPDKRGTGFWLHANPDKTKEFPAYHAPQVIFPMHYENPRKWKLLRNKMDPSNTPRNVFINEVLGEGADAGAKLVTQHDLIKACQLYGKDNKYTEMLANKRKYIDLAIGVDWGGSTAPYGPGRAHLLLNPTEAQSYTVLVVAGLLPTGRIDILYTFRFSLIGSHVEEAKACFSAWSDVDAGRGNTLFCHDYGGAGSVRETLIVQAGLPLQSVCGCQYVHAPQQNLMTFQAKGGRGYWSLDKARSLIFLCTAIKSGFIGFPSWISAQTCLKDFLALVEDVVERPGGANIVRVIRKPGIPDDTAQAVNYACAGLWHRHGYPNMGDIINAEQQLARLAESANAIDADEAASLLHYD